MRYYEIADRPRAQTATDRITRDEPRHLQHNAGRIGRAVEVCGCPTTLPKPSHMLLTRTTYRRDAVPRGQVRYPRHGSRWRFIRSRSTLRPAMQSVVSGMPASLAEHWYSAASAPSRRMLVASAELPGRSLRTNRISRQDLVSVWAARQFALPMNTSSLFSPPLLWNDEAEFLGNIPEENGPASLAHRSGSVVNYGISQARGHPPREREPQEPDGTDAA